MDGIDLAHEVRGALGHPLERMREFPPSGAYMPKLSVLVAAEEALTSAH